MAGPRTPDAFPGDRQEEQTTYYPIPGPLDSVGGVGFDGTSFMMSDSLGQFDPRNDEKVLVDGADTTPGYLGAKLVAGTNVTLTTLNTGSNESIEISVASTSLPAATCCGQILLSVDGLAFTPQRPLVSLSTGWLFNNDGDLLVMG
jgi:hypothetical protein